MAFPTEGKALDLRSSILPYTGTCSWAETEYWRFSIFFTLAFLYYCNKWFKVWALSSYADNWQIRFLSSSTGLPINWYSEASNWLTTMPFWVSKNPEDPIKYLFKLLIGSAGYILKVILDYLKESVYHVGYFASHAYELGNARGNHGAFLEVISRFLMETFHFWAWDIWLSLVPEYLVDFI